MTPADLSSSINRDHLAGAVAALVALLFPLLIYGTLTLRQRSPTAALGQTTLGGVARSSKGVQQNAYPAEGQYGVTPRTELKRYAHRGAYDFKTVHSILDEAYVCHLGFVANGQPFVIPTAFGRVGQTVYIHGSSGSRMMKALRNGAECCFTVTLIDGFKVARSYYNHDFQYRSMVALGKCRHVTEEAEKMAAMHAIVEHIIPGRAGHARPANKTEVPATAIIALELSEVSAKVSDGGPKDDEADLSLPYWAGVIPLTTFAGAPQADSTSLARGDSVPPHISQYMRPAPAIEAHVL